MEQRENTLTEIKEAKCKLENEIKELLKGFAKQFPELVIGLTAECVYEEKFTKDGIVNNLKSVKVKSYLTI